MHRAGDKIAIRVFSLPLAALVYFLCAMLAAPLTAVAEKSTPRFEPLALHPENPHYFLFRGEPTVLITSGEHYGAVLNREFDHAKYLETLQKDGMNLTRTFSGAYVEPQGAFNIARNTLAPSRGSFICPWARSETPGYPNGGNKFDLKRWDEAYFARLAEFLEEASRRGVVVEYVFFCPFYREEQWKLSPMNAANNVNGVGKVARTEVYTLDKHGGLLEYQEALVRKVVRELNSFDNLYWEICNEPYFGGVTMEWQHRIADVIVAAEKDQPRRHLISRNVANHKAQVKDPHPAVSIFNFHYASPPVTVEMNYGLDKAIGDNETGFKGTGDAHYRMEGWEFILAGGGLYNNLDYSFTVGHEDGMFDYPDSQPGGGGAALRRQLRILQDFISSFDFIRMRPAADLLHDELPKGCRVQLLAEPGRQYAAYVHGGRKATLELEAPKGRYRVEWLSPRSGKVAEKETREHGGGRLRIASPDHDGEIALRILRVSRR